MEKFLDRLVEILKLSPRYLFLPMLLVSGFALFAPANILDFLGLTIFASQYRSYLGAAFLVAAACITVSTVHSVYGWAHDSITYKRNTTQRQANWRQRLHRLTEEEKELLRGYIQDGTRTQNLPIDSGIVSGLVHEGVIYRASDVGSLLQGFAFNIQPWAWDYLNSHADLLVPSVDVRKAPQRSGNRYKSPTAPW